MKKIIITALMSILFSAQAFANYTMVVPQKPGGGTSVWAQIVATELEKYLDEKIIIKHIPGARDIPGFNKFHNDLQFNEKTIMVSHGGNGVAFLQENVDYDYRKYDSVGMMNLNIIAAKRKDSNFSSEKVKFASGSGMVPEAFAMTMLLCGPDKSVDEYIQCFNEKVYWVKGMSGGQRRLSFKNGELNGTRENPAAFIKHVLSNKNAELWFHHGILQADGTHSDDPNYPGYQFEILFKELYGIYPNGEFYNAYKLVKSFRDGLQKAMWMSKNNPHIDTVRSALNEMSKNPESAAIIKEKVGNYEWIIGEDGNVHVKTLVGFISDKALDVLVKFNNEALGLNSIRKNIN
jgi:hypothetical protein